MLKTINLEATKVSKISICGDCCPFLETLRLSLNEDLREIEILPATLKSLYVYKCKVLKDIRGVRGLKNLKNLSIEDCEEVDGLSCFSESASLETFKLKGSSKVKKIAGLQELRSLRELSIELDELPSLAELTSLRKITLQKCNKWEKIERLDHLRSLEELKISDCPELEALPSLLKRLTSLEKLMIDNCPELDGLPSLAELTSLEELELENCHKLKKIKGLESLQSLKKLKISDCQELDGLPSLAKLVSLENFELEKCHKLEKIEDLGSLPSLKNLKIIDCPELDGLPSLAELVSLEEFELSKCHKLKKIEGLDSLRSLKTLNISDCPELDGLPCLIELTSLKNFGLRMCHKLEKIEGLERLGLLERLEVHARSNAPCIIGLEHCERLKSLVVVANDIPVVEPFISNIQKWPREVIICTRAVIDVGSLKNFFTSFPLKDVVEFGLFGGLNLRRPESFAHANAILICFIIDSVYPNLPFYIHTDRGNRFYTELANGTWLWMGIFPQGSDWLQSNRYEIRTSIEDKDVKGKDAWFVMGEEGSILEAFHQLSQRKHSRLRRID